MIDLSTADTAAARQRLTPAPGYALDLFASEADFPIQKPVALAFDSRGRMWVGTMPSYPHYEPGDPPIDQIVILEDTDGDGRADKHTVFADSLYLALGFELGDGGVYVSQQPNFVFLRDTNGDDVADERRVVLHGFGTEDSHHAISTFTWGPDGALYMQEGTFLHSQVETPYGPVRSRDAATFRYEPGTEKLSIHAAYPFVNAWGHVFDRWGQDFIADASDGSNYFALPITGRQDYPAKHLSLRSFTSTRVRPTGGAEILSSRHFPDDVQGNFLLTNVIGFQGIKSHRFIEEGSGFTTREAEPLLTSRDINFRPIDLEVGPDGALYVVDWFNPLIGHMQYSMRDPRRDRTHGRIWRISRPDRPLLAVVNLESLSLSQLLDQLKEPEDRTRYRVRRELRVREREEVRRGLGAWVEALDPAAADHEHHLLEALWAYQSRDMVKPDLLLRLLSAREPRARAAATRVARFWADRLTDPLALLRERVNDEHPRVRLEAVVALSYIPTADAAWVALDALKHPRDYYLDYALNETITALEKVWRPVLVSGQALTGDNTEGVLYLLDRLAPEEVGRVARTEAVSRSLLGRGGVPIDVRRTALRDLASARGTSRESALVQALRAVDGRPEAPTVVAALVTLLGEAGGAELTPLAGELERLALGAKDAEVRHAGYAGLLRAGGGMERAWTLAATNPGRMADLLQAVRHVHDAKLQGALFPRVRDVLRRQTTLPPQQSVHGRYVRIEQPGCCETQSLAEVQVFDGTVNLAPSGSAAQKSTAAGGEPTRAIDGNTAGTFRAGSVSQSSILEVNPWWELDLGEARPISSVVIWRRTDEQIGGDMNGFHLRVLGSDRSPVWVREKNSAEPQPIVFSLGGDSASLVRRAAVRALSALEVNRDERLALFGDLLARGTDRDLALEALAELIPSAAPSPHTVVLAEHLLDAAAAIPAPDRTGPTFQRVAAVARALAPSLPAREASRLAAGIEALLPKTVRIRAIEGEMRFDLGSFAVAAAQDVELVLENPDHMPHNLVVTIPGAADRVGRAADAMAAQPDGFQKNFVPESAEVVVATPLVNAGGSFTLRFRAPTAPGEYPFICTFPGHWITMRGIMRVESRAGVASR
ncbi:MAG: dehydrogenase [Gemmatimonadetes bacterium]|nr:dehydrogenase [Gemmatimonadota bacterium]